jgi:hypothetical protein
MSNFNFGKEAALNELAELIDDGATMSDVLEVIESTLGDQTKVASEDDMDFRLGLEATCHDFLAKTAGLYGEFDASELDENEQAYVVFEKVAEGWKDSLKEKASKASEYAKGRASAGSAQAQRPVKALAAKMLDGQEVGSRRARVGAAMSRNSGRITAGTGLAAAGLLGAGAYGANKLRQKRNAEREKTASYDEGDVETALDILKQAGLLED